MKKKLIKTIIIMSALVSVCILPSCGKSKDISTGAEDIQTDIAEDMSGMEANALVGDEKERELGENSKNKEKEADRADNNTEGNIIKENNVEGVKEDSGSSEQNQTNPKKNEQNSLYSEQTVNNAEAFTNTNYNGGILKFVDVFGKEYEVEINPNIEHHKYDLNKFVRDGERLSYNDESFYSSLGVDVSHHQGKIDWQRVKAAGYDFAIIRLGYRGYGEAGNISLDREFEYNIENAQDAGLEVGVYFFSQAINEMEAVEEAEFVINVLNSHNITLPVVYDPESILDDVARTDNVTGEQFTKNTIAFCNRMKEAGYEPMVYSNMLWEAYNLNLEVLADYPIWYADYEPFPQTPYNFEYWQYTNQGKVDGISGNVDINIRIIEK